jgi:hypothetical protein
MPQIRPQQETVKLVIKNSYGNVHWLQSFRFQFAESQCRQKDAGEV